MTMTPSLSILEINTVQYKAILEDTDRQLGLCRLLVGSVIFGMDFGYQTWVAGTAALCGFSVQSDL